MAPDLFTDEKPVYTKKCDIYSTGIVFWEIATRKQPYRDITNTMVIPLKVKQGQLWLDAPEKCPPSYAKLMKRCWDLRAEQRPTTQELIDDLQLNKDEISNYQPTISEQSESEATKSNMIFM